MLWPITQKGKRFGVGMISKTLRQVGLFDELQFGSALNVALQQGRSSDFALMLSLLPVDIMDQAWVSDPVPLYEVQNQLARQFGVSQDTIFTQEKQTPTLLQADHNLAWHLAKARIPQTYPEKTQTQVLDNVPLTVQLKHRYPPRREPLKQSPQMLLEMLNHLKGLASD